MKKMSMITMSADGPTQRLDSGKDKLVLLSLPPPQARQILTSDCHTIHIPKGGDYNISYQVQCHSIINGSMMISVMDTCKPLEPIRGTTSRVKSDTAGITTTVTLRDDIRISLCALYTMDSDVDIGVSITVFKIM